MLLTDTAIFGFFEVEFIHFGGVCFIFSEAEQK